MNLSKSLLAIPVLSLVGAAAFASGACSSSVNITTGNPPTGIVYPAGISIGASCDGDIYFADDTGYVICDGGSWAYVDSADDIPSGYTINESLESAYLDAESSSIAGGGDTTNSDDTSGSSGSGSSGSSGSSGASDTGGSSDTAGASDTGGGDSSST